MAKKDTQKKLQEILDKKRKAEEELKAVRRQMAKEEREERKRCYVEMGKALESCLARNFCEDDIALFEAFIQEHEEMIKEIFQDAPEEAEARMEFDNADDIDTTPQPAEELPFGN